MSRTSPAVTEKKENSSRFCQIRGIGVNFKNAEESVKISNSQSRKLQRVGFDSVLSCFARVAVSFFFFFQKINYFHNLQLSFINLLF